VPLEEEPDRGGRVVADDDDRPVGLSAGEEELAGAGGDGRGAGGLELAGDGGVLDLCEYARSVGGGVREDAEVLIGVGERWGQFDPRLLHRHTGVGRDCRRTPSWEEIAHRPVEVQQERTYLCDDSVEPRHGREPIPADRAKGR
jgi:hypothetical protein